MPEAQQTSLGLPAGAHNVVAPRVPTSSVQPITDKRTQMDADARKATKVSLIIPALNEENAIGSTVDTALAMFRSHGIDGEVVVVDDGSTDRSAEIAEQHGARVVRHLERRGYGYALRSGLLAIDNETVVISDADGTYPLADIPRLIEEFNKGYDLVIGARTGKHFRGGLIKNISRRVFLQLCRTATGERIPDANSGLRVFRRSVILPYLPMMCTGFSFTTSQVLCFMSLTRPVRFVPIEYHERVGRTKVRHLWDSIRTAQYILQMFAIFNPVKLFTLIAFIPAVLGMMLLGLAGVGWLAGANWPTAAISLIASIALATAAIVFSFGFVIFGVMRQRLPDVISGIGSRPPSSDR